MSEITERIEEIKGRLAKATPGPWARAIFDPELDPKAIFAENLSYGAGDVHSVIAPEHPKSKLPSHAVTTAITGNGPTSEANRDFIANCPDDIDWLIMIVEGLVKIGRQKDERICALYQGSEEEVLAAKITALESEIVNLKGHVCGVGIHGGAEVR